MKYFVPDLHMRLLYFIVGIVFSSKKNKSDFALIYLISFEEGFSVKNVPGRVPGTGKRGRKPNGKRPRPFAKLKQESIKPNAFTFYLSTFNLITRFVYIRLNKNKEQE